MAYVLKIQSDFIEDELTKCYMFHTERNAINWAKSYVMMRLKIQGKLIVADCIMEDIEDKLTNFGEWYSDDGCNEKITVSWHEFQDPTTSV